MHEAKDDPIVPTPVVETAPAKPVRARGVVWTSDEDYSATAYAGRATIKDEINEEAAALQNSSVMRNFGDAMSSGSNIAYQVLQSIGDTAAAGPVDPNWNNERAVAWIDAQGPAIDMDQRWRYLSANNETHAKLILDQSVYNSKTARELSLRKGPSAWIAPIATSLVDIDLPLAIAGGGLAKGARFLATATRAAPFFRKEALRVLKGGASGGALLTTMGAADYAADPNAEWAVIPTLGVLGAGIGMVAPGLGKLATRASEQQLKAADELADAVQRGVPPDAKRGAGDLFGIIERRNEQIAEYEDAIANPKLDADGKPLEPPPEPFAVAMDKADLDPIDGYIPEKGIGAQAYAPGHTGPGVSTIQSTQIQKTISKAERELAATGAELKLYDDIIEMDRKYPHGVGKAAYYMKEAINSTLTPNFHRLFRGNSAVAKLLATKLFTDPEGILRNVESADSMMRTYQWDIMAKTVPYHQGFGQFIKATHPSMGVIEQFTQHARLQDEYARKVIDELQGRAYDPPGTVRVTPEYIKKAADAIDRFHATELKQGKGLAGETGRFGYDQIKERSGYFKQNLNSNKYRKVLTDLSARYGSKKARMMMNKIVAKAYIATDPTLAPKDALLWATATVNAAASKDAGLSTNLIGLLADGGSEKLYGVLINNGISQKEANSLIDKLLGTGKNKRKQGHLKHRLDIDLRMTIDGVHMMDLFDTDMMQHLNRRGRQSAGMSALARIGIDSRQALAQTWEAISAEQAAKGGAVPGVGVAGKADNFLNATREIGEKDWNDMMSYFTGDPIAGGMSPLLSEVRKVTQLALLNQLGLTSLGEFGPIWAAYGFSQFWKELPSFIKMAAQDKGSVFIKELQDLDIIVPEERLMPDGGHYELDQLNMSDLDSMRQQVRSGLNQATHMQGYLSGFNHVRRLTQYMSAHMMTARLFEGLKFGKTATTSAVFSPERMADLGLSKANDIARMKRLADGATFDASGRFQKLNIDQWTEQDVQWYKRILYGSVDKYVHLARAGETTYWFHKGGVASLFFHLKSFPLTAMGKQAYRNARIGDTEALHAFAFGLATAGMVYGTKQLLNGQTQNLDPVSIGMGALSYSNFTGWLPMWGSPILALAGMDVGNGRGPTGNLMPAGLSVLQRLAEIPGIPADMFDGDLSNSSIRGLQALPIVGNIYGAPLIWNAMKKDAKHVEKPAVPKGPRMTPTELEEYRAQSGVPAWLQPDDEMLQEFYGKGDIKKAEKLIAPKRMSAKELAAYRKSSSVPSWLQPDDELLQTMYGNGQIQK